VVKMKKLLVVLLLVITCVTGCGKKGTENVVNDFTAKVNDTNSYTLKGNMEIYSDEETFTYSLEVDFLKDYCEVVYLPRTPEISTTQIKKDLRR